MRAWRAQKPPSWMSKRIQSTATPSNFTVRCLGCALLVVLAHAFENVVVCWITVARPLVLEDMDQNGSRKLCATALGLLFRRVGQDRVGQMTTWTSKVAHLGD